MNRTDPRLTQLREDLTANADEQTRTSGVKFFKEAVKLHGVKTAVGTRIAKKHFQPLTSLDKSEVFALCEELWRSGYMEESFVACNWTYELRKRYQPDDFAVFERWVSTYVSNWAACDTLCNHSIGAFLEMYPDYLSRLHGWTASENRWMRRAAAVSLIIPARQGKFLDDVFTIADLLLEDADDLVQKGYGWMLKVASQAHQDDVFGFVMERKARMPRTALRYAIEKMPKDLRAQAM